MSASTTRTLGARLALTSGGLHSSYIYKWARLRWNMNIQVTLIRTYPLQFQPTCCASQPYFFLISTLARLLASCFSAIPKYLRGQNFKLTPQVRAWFRDTTPQVPPQRWFTRRDIEPSEIRHCLTTSYYCLVPRPCLNRKHTRLRMVVSVDES